MEGEEANVEEEEEEGVEGKGEGATSLIQVDTRAELVGCIEYKMQSKRGSGGEREGEGEGYGGQEEGGGSSSTWSSSP